MRRRRTFPSVLTLTCLASCALVPSCGLTLGPTVGTELVILKPGLPLEVIKNVTVTGRRLNDTTVVQQDVGGWVVMPREHFDALMRATTPKVNP